MFQHYTLNSGACKDTDSRSATVLQRPFFVPANSLFFVSILSKILEIRVRAGACRVTPSVTPGWPAGARISFKFNKNTRAEKHTLTHAVCHTTSIGDLNTITGSIGDFNTIIAAFSSIIACCSAAPGKVTLMSQCLGTVHGQM